MNLHKTFQAAKVVLLDREISMEQMLKNLGLTVNQAKVYLSLLEMGPLKVSEITKTTRITRPNVYPTLERLQQLGIVEKILTTPSSYKATPLREAVALLLEAKTLEYEKARAAAELMHSIEQKGQKPKTSKELKNQFVLIPEGKTIINRIASAIKTAENSIEIAVSWRRFVQGVSVEFGECFEKTRKNKVKFRVIIEKPPTGEDASKLITLFKEKTSASIRFLSKPLPSVFGVYDKREIFIISMPEADLKSSPALWSNSTSLVLLVSEYFEMLWANATENIPH